MAIDWDKVLLAPVVAVFGEPVIYLPMGGSSYQMNMVYDEANKDMTLADGMGVNTSKPIVSGRLLLFQNAPMQGDQVKIVRTGETFVVKDVDTDGHGSVKLELNFVSAS
ncbi:head-tail joining protein [Undibacterium sp. MH2W]|uniref:head-tail joining protein n=1 Tax=Undibacterium sp. MH2W TaxID=3413044 RepID=UPI003BF290A6